MKILRNYILRDFFTIFVFSILIVTTVLIMGNMIQVSDMVLRKGMNIVDALKILSFGIPRLAGFIIPPSFLFGVLLVMGRLIADNELIAIRVAGIPLVRILLIFLPLAVICTLGLFLLNDRIIPDLHYRYNEMKGIYSRNITTLIEPGVFLEISQKYILLVDDKKDNKLKNVYIYEIDDKKSRSRLTHAKEGEFIVENDILKIKLENGFRDEASPENPTDLYRLTFKVFFMDIPIEKKTTAKRSKKPADMTTAQMHEKMRYLETKGIDPVDKPISLQKEFHKRISSSCSVLAFVLLGFGVSLIVKHREKTINFFVAVVGIFFYYLLLMLGEVLIEEGIIAPAWGMWLPTIIIGLIGGFLVLKHAHSR